MSESSSSLIASFTASPATGPSGLSIPPALTVNLSWQTAPNTQVILEGYGLVPNSGEDGQATMQVTITKSTTFVLLAFAPQLNQADAASQTITVPPARVPAGAILPWGSSSGMVPPGWLLCDGSAYKTSEYSALHSAIQNTFTSVPQAGMFCVPDLRGYFDCMGMSVPGPGSLWQASQLPASNLGSTLETSPASDQAANSSPVPWIALSYVIKA